MQQRDVGTLSPVGERGATTQEYEPRGREGVGRLRRRPLPPRSGHTLLPGEAGPSPRAPSAVQWGLPARPCSFLPTSLHEVGGVGVLGGSQGSLPIPAAQLPAVLILAALRVVHLVHTETLLEVLGPDLGVQDLLSHVAGEPASLLVMQTLAEDPAWEGGETKCPKLSQVAWVGPPSGAWEAGGRETAESGRPSQGPLPSHLLMERLRPGVPPETVGGALLGGTAPVPREAEEPPTPCAIAGPTRIDFGTHSQALSNLRLPHLWPGNPKRHPQTREASRGWWDGSWPRMPPSPSCWAALP